MLDDVATTKFKKDFKKVKKQGKDLNLLKQIIEQLRKQEALDIKYKDHALTNNWKGARECHLEPDWLLIYEVSKKNNTLTLLRTGSHSELLEDLNMLQKLDNIIHEALK